MKKDPKIFLQHILESIEAVEQHIKGLTKEDFFKSVKTQDAVIRRLEIIGEATKNLPNDYKEAHPDVSWHKAMAMRNILIHEYFGIELNIVWDTATKTLPEFKEQIEGLPEMSK